MSNDQPNITTEQHAANVVAAITDPIDHDALVAAWSAIPGNVRAHVLPHVLRDPAAVPYVVAVMDAYDASRQAAATRRQAPDLTDDDRDAVARHVLRQTLAVLPRGDAASDDDRVAALVDAGAITSDAISQAVTRASQAADRAARSTTRRPVAGTVADLLAAGIITDGQRLTGPADTRATVRPDGSIRVAGTDYATPSAAARAFLGHAVNGWQAWTVTGGAHDGTRLGDLRAHLAQ